VRVLAGMIEKVATCNTHSHRIRFVGAHSGSRKPSPQLMSHLRCNDRNENEHVRSCGLNTVVPGLK
jgi:hypothetical protein